MWMRCGIRCRSSYWFFGDRHGRCCHIEKGENTSLPYLTKVKLWRSFRNAVYSPPISTISSGVLRRFTLCVLSQVNRVWPRLSSRILIYTWRSEWLMECWPQKGLSNRDLVTLEIDCMQQILWWMTTMKICCTHPSVNVQKHFKFWSWGRKARLIIVNVWSCYLEFL